MYLLTPTRSFITSSMVVRFVTTSIIWYVTRFVSERAKIAPTATNAKLNDGSVTHRLLRLTKTVLSRL